MRIWGEDWTVGIMYLIAVPKNAPPTQMNRIIQSDPNNSN